MNAQIENNITLNADRIDRIGATNKNKQNGLAPAQYSIGKIILSITNDVPRSG